MKLPYKICLSVGVVAVIGSAAYFPLRSYWESRNQPKYRLVEVTQGKIISEINSTGTVKPVLSIQVGSFVSGPIVQLNADFNQQVKKDDLLAKIDPRLFEAILARDEAILASAEAEWARSKALLNQAENDEKRSKSLREISKDYISDTELDRYKFNRAALEAQVDAAKASIQSAQANLLNSNANLDYTDIRSPVDGVIIDRKIEEGQTLAAQFQTPELFVVAPDLEKEIHVFASVDEADIGLIRQAQQEDQPVKFTVSAYQDELFEGVIHQIRMSATTTENVVTYPVVVSAPNLDLKLMPGMTADVSFQVGMKEDVLKIPNAALRFYPPDEKRVHPQDRKILFGEDSDRFEIKQAQGTTSSAREMVEASHNRNRHHVWIVEGKYLRAVEIVIGLTDSKFSELLSGNIIKGQKLVTDVRRRSR